MKRNKGIASVTVVLAAIALLAIVAGAYYLGTQKEAKEENTSVIPDVTVRKIEGNKEDLVSFSVSPGDKISGVLNFSGTVQGAYFFEGNILINILDQNKNILKRGNAMATTEWMTSGPVSFSGSIDLAGLPPGPGYIQIQNDNPSDMRDKDKFIYIPVTIE